MDILERHIYMRTRVFHAVLVLAAVAACSPDRSPAVAEDLRTRTPSIEETLVPRCNQDIPFEPTYLPDGLRHRLFEGRYPAGRPTDDQSSIGGEPGEQQVIVHYRGTGKRAIEVRRPGTLFAELALGDDAPTIEVLGTETPNFGPISPGGNDFIVHFSYPADAGPHEWCKTYSLNEYGLPLSELKKVAESLQPRSADRPFRLLIHCGLSYPLRYRGRFWLPVDTRLRRTHNRPDGFGSDDNYDMGTIRQIDEDTIIYTSSEGVEVEYEPTKRRRNLCR